MRKWVVSSCSKILLRSLCKYKYKYAGFEDASRSAKILRGLERRLATAFLLQFLCRLLNSLPRYRFNDFKTCTGFFIANYSVPNKDSETQVCTTPFASYKLVNRKLWISGARAPVWRQPGGKGLSPAMQSLDSQLTRDHVPDWYGRTHPHSTLEICEV